VCARELSLDSPGLDSESGLREVSELAIPPKSGEAKAELREFVCDNCGRKPKTLWEDTN